MESVEHRLVDSTTESVMRMDTAIEKCDEMGILRNAPEKGRKGQYFAVSKVME
jgi:hypothetical protein